MQSILTFPLLILLWFLSRILAKLKPTWFGEIEPNEWGNLRIIAILNHTSLYEPVMVGFATWGLLWRISRHGVLPVAEKTMKRRIGLFFRFLVRHVVVITRQRDQTWNNVLNKVDDHAVVIILPEGRMKRRDGLDSTGRPMTIRGGIADILEVLDDGRMLILYSGGLHHIQVPGQHVPKFFKTVRLGMELVEIPDYKAAVMAASPDGDFRRSVIDDLTARRDRHCPALEDPSMKNG
jgi:1-acyl-sn-glycerol-3-phosphate acyltransferase